MQGVETRLGLLLSNAYSVLLPGLVHPLFNAMLSSPSEMFIHLLIHVVGLGVAESLVLLWVQGVAPDSACDTRANQDTAYIK